jgi:hypothetical protein
MLGSLEDKNVRARYIGLLLVGLGIHERHIES